MSRTRLATLGVLLAALAVALFGGEYGIHDWLALRRDTRAEQARIDQLTVEVDSLTRYLGQLGSDRRLVERLARENMGMIRPGEFLYRIEPDSLDGR
ncbi:MAG: septum formation initiator family protein [Gemmatimonadetes bacterium]|nr:septum formation initiator family protein [Gemmatimonadota bacterium]MBK9693639.1 septum formation initiator family protein [Gemmatimonadota bacterium]